MAALYLFSPVRSATHANIDFSHIFGPMYNFLPVKLLSDYLSQVRFIPKCQTITLLPP